MMRNSKPIFIVLIIFIFISSCGIFKGNITKEVIDNDENIRIDEKPSTYKDSIEKYNLDYESLSINFSGSYTDDEKNLPLKGILRIKKNSFIWISLRPALSIEMGRLLLTKDSIKYIDRLKNEYFMEDYSYINRKFGVKLNYLIFESIFLNKFFTYPSDNSINDYFVINEEGTVKSINASGIYHGQNISHIININSRNWYIILNSLKILDANREFIIKYENFYTLGNKMFPEYLDIKLKDKEKSISVMIEYDEVNKNKTFDINFKIPKNYKRINFE